MEDKFVIRCVVVTLCAVVMVITLAALREVAKADAEAGKILEIIGSTFHEISVALVGIVGFYLGGRKAKQDAV